LSLQHRILLTPICSSNRTPQIVPCDHPTIAFIGSANRVKAISDHAPIDPKLWWIMPAFDTSNITFVLLLLRCGLPPTPVVMTSRHNVVMPHGIMSQRRDVTPPLLIVLYMTSYNGFAAKFTKNALKHWIKWIFRHNIAINGWFSRPIWIFDIFVSYFRCLVLYINMSYLADDIAKNPKEQCSICFWANHFANIISLASYM
jgi:hypothetical protein